MTDPLAFPAFIVAAAAFACVLVAVVIVTWRLAKAGGSVNVTFGVHVNWGKHEKEAKKIS